MLKFISIQLVSLFYLLITVSAFLYKRKKNDFESMSYQILLFITMLVVLLDIAYNISFIYSSYDILNIIFSKCYLIFSIIWCYWLLIYVVTINTNKDYKSIKQLIKDEILVKWGIVLNVLLCIGTILLKTEYYFNLTELVSYMYGPAIYYTHIVSFAYMGFIALYMIYNPKKVSFAKRLPVFVFLLLAMIAICIEWINPTITLVSSVMVFVLTIIYFTMENPDLKIINELEKNKEEANEASKAKTDFLSNMSHDIRTPMNAIIGFSESLLMENLTDNQKVEVENIYEAAMTLLAIINNILDVSRIESGKEEKNEKPYELKKVIMQLTSVITSKIDKSKVRLNVQIDKNVPTHFIGDELKIYQILMNLLSNAAKYTEQGNIDFLLSSENIGDSAKLKFVVADTGFGIKKEDFDKLFVKFSRIHNQENYRQIEGTGLGLVITKSLVELLGGTISFESEYGKGTTFTVVIPQKIYHNDDLAGAPNVDKSKISNVHFDGSLYDILVVDDNNLNLKVAERILSDYHFHITLASSGEECISKLKEGNRYDMIFLDHMMPVMDGIQTLKQIKNLENVKIPPIIALTANAMVGMKEMYLNEGFDGYISKPINREELQTLLNNFFCQK